MLIALAALAITMQEMQPFAGLQDWKRDHEKRITWWREARFGMFIHWGLYSTAGGRWNGKDYEQQYAEWIQNWAAVPTDEYAKALKPLFKPSKDCIKEWATLAKEAGMKYAVLTAKHHEGFTLFNSKHPYSIQNGTNISPQGRDLVGEFCYEFRTQGLHAGIYYSLLDWQHPNAYEIDLPIKAQHKDHQKYVEYFHAQVKELLSNYGKIDTLWFDFSSPEVQGAKWGAKALLQDIRKLQPQIIVNNRLWNGIENQNADICTPEKYVPMTGFKVDWETNHTLNESYGFSYHDNNWKSAKDVIRLLAEVVSKGGNLLLNIGPDPTGAIPTPAIETLKGVGKWMKLNGESIYGTQAGPTIGEGVCTQKAKRFYLHIFNWPENGQLELPKKATRAYLLATKTELPLDGNTIRLPSQAPDPADTVIVVETR